MTTELQILFLPLLVFKQQTTACKQSMKITTFGIIVCWLQANKSMGKKDIDELLNIYHFKSTYETPIRL